jgi:hypothetical protein
MGWLYALLAVGETVRRAAGGCFSILTDRGGKGMNPPS